MTPVTQWRLCSIAVLTWEDGGDLWFLLRVQHDRLRLWSQHRDLSTVTSACSLFSDHKHHTGRGREEYLGRADSVVGGGEEEESSPLLSCVGSGQPWLSCVPVTCDL